jgi:serine O-acetyltransferase
VTLFPWITIGLRAGDVQGATIESDASIGTGAKVIGGVRVGAGASVGANAVVVDDVPPGATVVGVPARVVSRSQSPSD